MVDASCASGCRANVMSGTHSRRFRLREQPAEGNLKTAYWILTFFFFLLALTIVVTNLLPLLIDQPLSEVTIEVASVEWRDYGSDGGSGDTVRLIANDGSVYKINPILSRHMDLVALELLLFRAGSADLTIQDGHWIVGIAVNDEVFFDVDSGLYFYRVSELTGVVFGLPLFLSAMTYCLIQLYGTKKFPQRFFKRRNNP